MVRKIIINKISIIFVIFFALGVISNTRLNLQNLSNWTGESKSLNSILANKMQECEIYEYSDSNFLNSERRTCYNDKIFNNMRSEGLKDTLVGLEEYMQTEQGKYLVGTRCHDIGHGIGIEAVKQGLPAREILETCNTSCGGGCLNGAGHVFVTTSAAKGDLDSFCNLDNINKTIRDMCYHGIGHGLMEYYGLDITKVIAACQKIERNSDKFQCGHAAFMDTNLVGRAPFDRIPKELYNYCAGLENVLRYSCFQFGGFLTYVRELDVDQAFDFCVQTHDLFKNICFTRIGESAYLRNNGDAEKTLALCERTDASEFRSCLKGANIFSVHTPDSSFGTKAKNICVSSPNNVRGGCLSDLGAIIVKTYGQKQLEEFCSDLAKKNQESCFDINQAIINEPDFVQAD